MTGRSPCSLSVLGPLEAGRGDERVRLGGPQPRRVLAALAVNANAVVSSDRLIEVLWGEEPPASAAHTLQAVVSRLRGSLGADRVETVAPGYRLRVDATELDALRFEALVRTGLASVDRPEAAAAMFEEALALWRGRPYTEFADEEFTSAEVRRLEELRLCAVEEHAAAVVELGRAGEVIGGLEAEIAAEPLRERLRAVVLLALARAGRPVEASRAYEAYRQFLADEVGGVPSPELRRLNDEILRQEPGLGWERPSGGVTKVEQPPTGTVTFLFTDLEGSTRLWQEHPDTMTPTLARHDAILRAAVESHRGRVVKTTGDGVHAVFASAHDAVDAAIAALLELQAEPWGEPGPLRVRMGLHTGEADQRDGDYYGPAVNQAARLMAIAHGGQIVCSGAVAELVGDDVELLELGVHRLRDIESALRVFQVLAPGLESKFPPLGSLDAYRSNLPHELSDLIGRADDVAAVAKALAEARVVSIVGVGGVGKTRLALQVGSDLLPAFADGVWWCELAGVRDPDAVPEAVAAALGYTPSLGMSLTDGLATFFRHKQLLLVLDNCEHLLGAVANFVLSMGQDAPRLSVLATSREALAIHGERTYPLPPLELPVDASPFSVEASAAGSLFAARAREARGSFAVTEENAAAIAELCEHLDANALAIELAAARTSMMSPAEILARLDQRFRLLAGRSRDAAERHQTLHAAIDWSHALLEPPEQTLLQWLSVFIGDFDLAAATAIAADAGLDEFEAVDQVASLVAKSLLEHDEAGGVSRYRLLETIRHFAAEQLAAGANTDRARDAHATHYLASARELFGMLRTPRDFDALEQLRVETPNLAAALRWRIASDRVPDVLGFFADAGWVDNGLVPYVLVDELGRVADQALRRHGTGRAHGYISALFYSGLRAFHVGDTERYAEVVAAAHEADPGSLLMVGPAMGVAAVRGDIAAVVSIGLAGIEQARRSGEREVLAYLLSLTALGEMGGGDPVHALNHAEEAVEVARTSPATSVLVYPLCQLSVVLAAQKRDPDRALAAAQECIRLDRTHRRAWSTLSEGTASQVRFDRGEVAAGLRLRSDIMHRLEWSGELGYLSMQFPGLADALAHLDPVFALDLAAIAESGAISPFPVFDMLQGFPSLSGVVDELGPDAVRAARARAASMSYDEAVQYVFDGIDRLIAQALPAGG